METITRGELNWNNKPARKSGFVLLSGRSTLVLSWHRTEDAARRVINHLRNNGVGVASVPKIYQVQP